jgi:hypothetical protein
VAVDVLLRLVEQMPAPYGLAALVTAFAGLPPTVRKSENRALIDTRLAPWPSGAPSQTSVLAAASASAGSPDSKGISEGA